MNTTQHIISSKLSGSTSPTNIEYISLKFTDNQIITPIENSNQFVKIKGDYLLGEKLGSNLINNDSGEIISIGSNPYIYELKLHITYMVSSIFNTLNVQFFKNGTPIGVVNERYINVSDNYNYNSLFLFCDTTLTKYDVLDVRASSTRSSLNLTVRDLIMSVKKIG